MILKLSFDGYRGALDYFSENFRHDFRANERVSHDLNNRGSSSFLTFDGRLVTVSPVGNAKYDVYVFPVDDPDSAFYAEKLKDRLRNPSAFLYPMVW